MLDTYYHSIRFDDSTCHGCMACMRVCPTQAIRIRHKRAVMLEDRCIDCGECIKSCTRNAVVPLTESMANLAKFDCTVAIPSPALYTQFDGDVTPGVILQALRNSGFTDAATLSWSCGAVTQAIELFVAAYRGPRPLISSFCPSVVRLVQVKYPELVDQLLPILSPREVAAREAKLKASSDTGLPPDRIGAVYVTPCPAKMVSIVDHPGMDRSYIDSAVGISELFPLLAPAIREVQTSGQKVAETETAAGLGWAFSINLPSSLPAEDTLSVWGLPNVLRILDDIDKGKLHRYTFVECHACFEGCVSGALTVENPYVARARALRLGQSLPRRDIVSGPELQARHARGDFATTAPFAPRPPRPLGRDIVGAIAKMQERDRLLDRLPGIDCGACGAPTCAAFAEDVVIGEAEEAQCVFVRQGRLEDAVRRLSEGPDRLRQAGPRAVGEPS
ncbi:MAG: 4Fe-4S binding protein [Acidobacteria bacterium]|nr:4Fe-4S binding protein [Acidobacteriota bacterium]